MKAVPRGVYTVEMIVDEDGDFKVDMMCSIDGHDEVDLSEGTVLRFLFCPRDFDSKGIWMQIS